MSQIVSTRNLFVNSEQTVVGNSRDVRINLPQQFASAEEHQTIRLTLQTFSMFRNYYSVNENNNKFYVAGIQGGALISQLIEIPVGNYQSYDNPQYGLCAKILGVLKANLAAAPFSIPAVDIANSTATWDYLTNQIQITLDLSNAPGGAITGVKLLTFTLSEYNPSTVPNLVSSIIGQNYNSAFQSAWMILGGCNVDNQGLDVLDNANTDTQNLAAIRGMYGSGGAGGLTFTGYWRAQLTSEDNIYLRTDLNTDAQQTAGFDANSSLFPYVVSSTILAKIPIPDPVADYQVALNAAGAVQENYLEQNIAKQIHYVDNGNNMYSCLLTQKHLGQLRLYLTDRYGRPLPIGAEQLDCDASPFTCTVRCDILE